ncbi:cytochrome c oxidase assembly protein [Microvirga lenta]|uniref:cytochrome c oxidase assembly protein n=1 Tax=Microvirga lenta TaxID=2881337 RepID=UPI001CFF1FEF|nr:cytochrome c oxidase assembly protein [Microvirga lenta]MCB5173597.1 cytochrome c oxidase assembly protein [Microvirga lenta]
MDELTTIAYCGSPPVPGSVAWNTDPILIGILAATAGLYALGCRRSTTVDGRRQASFYLGWAILAAALVSPLCNLSVALFSARVAQHMILILLAAPLVVLGQPGAALRALAPGWTLGRLGHAAERHLPAIATIGFAVTLWTWHLPGPYDATLRSDIVYWIMHLTTFAAALGLWHTLFSRMERVGSTILVSFATTIQMSLLGALLTLAPRPLFEPHAGTTWPWGLSPLDDQQLGGVIMWVPGGLLFTLFGLAAIAVGLQRLGSAGPDPVVRGS